MTDFGDAVSAASNVSSRLSAIAATNCSGSLTAAESTIMPIHAVCSCETKAILNAWPVVGANAYVPSTCAPARYLGSLSPGTLVRVPSTPRVIPATMLLDSALGNNWMTPLRAWVNPSALSLRERPVTVRIAIIRATGSSIVAGTLKRTGAH